MTHTHTNMTRTQPDTELPARPLHWSHLRMELRNVQTRHGNCNLQQTSTCGRIADNYNTFQWVESHHDHTLLSSEPRWWVWKCWIPQLWNRYSISPVAQPNTLAHTRQMPPLLLPTAISPSTHLSSRFCIISGRANGACFESKILIVIATTCQNRQVARSSSLHKWSSNREYMGDKMKTGRLSQKPSAELTLFQTPTPGPYRESAAARVNSGWTDLPLKPTPVAPDDQPCPALHQQMLYSPPGKAQRSVLSAQKENI